MDFSPIRRRPHKSPAHTVKDLRGRPQRLSLSTRFVVFVEASRTSYTVFEARQQHFRASFPVRGGTFPFQRAAHLTADSVAVNTPTRPLLRCPTCRWWRPPGWVDNYRALHGVCEVFYCDLPANRWFYSGADQFRATEVPFSDLHDALKTYRNNQLHVGDDFAVQTDRPFAHLAGCFAVAAGQRQLRQ